MIILFFFFFVFLTTLYTYLMCRFLTCFPSSRCIKIPRHLRRAQNLSSLYLSITFGSTQHVSMYGFFRASCSSGPPSSMLHRFHFLFYIHCVELPLVYSYTVVLHLNCFFFASSSIPALSQRNSWPAAQTLADVVSAADNLGV